MLQFCKAMADESRLKIVGLLSASEHSVQDLAALLNLKEPTVSHHLAVLKELDLVRLRAEGNIHWYRMSQDVLRKISRAVFSTENIARMALSSEADVNAILKQHHQDCATLRRELIGYRMLSRAGGVYRRNADSEWLRAPK